MTATAYLKTDCEQCNGSVEYPSELAGQPVECPHCQQTTTLPFAPQPAVPPAIPSARLARSGRQGNEEVFFNERGITVSKTRFVAGSNTIALTGITSVDTVETKPNRVGPLISIFFCFALFTVSVEFAVVALVASIVWLCLQKSTFSVVLVTSGGETKAYTSSQKALISRISDAVSEAIVARG